MKSHKIIFFILISLISNKIHSKANNYELTMECIDGANKLTKYTKIKNNICMINSSNQEKC